MSGAPKQFDKEQVLSKALQRFWANGFEGTSMQDLVDAMGINRASMYTTFGNKRDLFDQAFDRYCASSSAHFKALLESDAGVFDKLEQLFMLLDSDGNQRMNYGCFVNNAAVELGPHDAVIAKKVRQFWGNIQDLLQQALDRAVANKELASNTDTKNLANLINMTLQGLSVMKKAGVDNTQTRQVVKQFLAMLARQ